MTNEFDGINVIRKTCEYAKKQGADKVQARLKRGEQHELNVDAGKMSLYRTTVNVELDITVHSAMRKGSLSINSYDDDAVNKAVEDALSVAKASEPDSANDISPQRPLEYFEYGPKEADSSIMYDRLNEFIDYSKSTYPDTKLEQCILNFRYSESFFANSNGAEFAQRSGLYDFSAMFTTKIGSQPSSFNYSGAVHTGMDKQLWQWGNVNELMRQSTEQVNVKPAEGSFTGDLIITPDCLGDFLHFLTGIYLGDYALITGNSPWKDMLDKQVASPILTIGSEPNSPIMDAKYFFTGDGFPAENCKLIENGILKYYSLGLYGANKTGKPRCPSGGGVNTVHCGTTALNDMIADVKKGILLGRFSGGYPADNGDFSGIAKNSYLIENGKITRPLGETMIAGNLEDLFKDIRAVSKESINYGSEIMPWVLSGNVHISGA